MNIILPIIFAAAVMGLFVKRIQPIHWGLMAFWIALIIAYFYVKH